MDSKTSTYEANELLDLVFESQSTDKSLTVYVPDCEMWLYLVKELYVSGFGGGVPEEPLSFVLGGSDGFECTKHADQIHKTYDSAKLSADKQQQELENKFGGKAGLDKLRLDAYDMMSHIKMNQVQ